MQDIYFIKMPQEFTEMAFPHLSFRYWPVIDDALRKAAFDRKVHVRLLASLWNHTRFDMKYYLQSLAALNKANFASVEVVCTPLCLQQFGIRHQ